LQLMLFEFGARGDQCGFSFARGLGIVGAFLLGHLKEHARLFKAVTQALEALDLALELVLFLQNVLGVLRAIPKFLFAGKFEEFFLAGSQFREVKDASRACPRGIRNRSVAL
jgi:hypothetical protein